MESLSADILAATYLPWVLLDGPIGSLEEKKVRDLAVVWAFFSLVMGAWIGHLISLGLDFSLIKTAGFEYMSSKIPLCMKIT